MANFETDTEEFYHTYFREKKYFFAQAHHGSWVQFDVIPNLDLGITKY